MYARISEEYIYIYIYHGTINRPFAGVSFPTWAPARVGTGLHGAIPPVNAACRSCGSRALLLQGPPSAASIRGAKRGREGAGRLQRPAAAPRNGGRALAGPSAGLRSPDRQREGWLGVSQRRFSESVHYGVFKPLLNDYLSLHADKMISRLLSE